MKRRESIKLMAAASLAVALPGCSPSDVDRAADRVAALAETKPLKDRMPTTLSAHQYATISILVDLILPTDEHSGSATDAGVPAFIDFIIEDAQGLETPLKGGLSWLDYESSKRFGSTFLDASGTQKTSIMDDIAWPEAVTPGMQPGVDFFNLLRDLTASGFWSSRMGVADLGYAGNSPRSSWEGCDDEAMRHLNLAYPES
jgi:Gluconate 2-dehydrogenase subunit 3